MGVVCFVRFNGFCFFRFSRLFLDVVFIFFIIGVLSFRDAR